MAKTIRNVERTFPESKFKQRTASGEFTTWNYDIRIPLHQGALISNEVWLSWFSPFFLARSRGGVGLYALSAALTAVERRVTVVSKRRFLHIRFHVLWFLPCGTPENTLLDGFSAPASPRSILQTINRGLNAYKGRFERKRAAVFFYDKKNGLRVGRERLSDAKFQMIVR
ncbi:MAG: hypothetical protein RIB57_13540 [Pelagibacterium sp.]|uniref:hypothetical protein n=1 Tax=Pelagibacterium sp. TaxID=1967288 RepID=UPI0032EE7F66